MLRKLLTWAVVAFVAFYLVSDPTGAAHFARSALDGLHTAAGSLSTFLTSI
jgi:hypothetical protein